MNNVAFLIPIHPPYFNYGRDFIESVFDNKLNCQSDIWFVFTNEDEQLEFGEWENTVILPEELRIFENGGIINIKKFYGLSQIKDKYEYVIVSDAESLIIKNINLKRVCEDYFTSKVLLGNHIFSESKDCVQKITDSCKSFYANCHNFKLLDSDLYLWFNQPCIYKTANLEDFFKKIDYKNKAKDLTYYHFDYYLYMFYLILFEGFKSCDVGIRSRLSFTEIDLETPYITNERYKNYKILCCSREGLKYYNNENLFLIYHLDRTPAKKIRRLERRMRVLEDELRVLKKKSLTYRIKKFLSIFIPNKNLRRKFRGDI